MIGKCKMDKRYEPAVQRKGKQTINIKRMPNLNGDVVISETCKQGKRLK